MKFRFNFLLLTGLLLTVTACAPAITSTPTSLPTPAGSSVHGVFEGITPCSQLTRPLPQIPTDTNCEQMLWKIILYQDAASGTPTTYTLNSAYGVPQPNTPGLAKGGTPIVMEGNWSIVKGTKTESDAVVYQLNSENSQPAVSFLKMDDDILHVLNRDQTLMIGNAAWSYTLNRTDNRPPYTLGEQSNPYEATQRPPIPTMLAASSVVGVYEGRIPCHEIVFELMKLPPYDGCAKMKSQLTLYKDPNTGEPTTYVYLGTTTIREGTWTILKGTKSNPEAVEYQLNLDGSQQPVSFLNVDENHLFLLDRAGNLLVGNAFFSYTLSRTDNVAQ